MAFYETHFGYVGLGATEVFRTAAQAASDLEVFGKETGELDAAVKKQGGLLAQRELYTYATSRGRLRDLDLAASQIEKDIDGLQQQMKAKINELESMGVPNAGAMIGQSAMMIATFWIPGLAALSFFGINPFGGKKNERKRRAENLMKDLQKLKSEIEWRAKQHEELTAEGKHLAEVMATGTSKDITTSLTYIPQKRTVSWALDKDKKVMTKTEAIVDVKDPYLPTFTEAKKRAELTPGTVRLPEGFQTIYSPALKEKAIVVQTVKKDPAESSVVTGRKLVFGGLAGPLDRPDVTFMWLTLGGMALFTYMLATEPPLRPIRRKVPSYRHDFYHAKR